MDVTLPLIAALAAASAGLLLFRLKRTQDELLEREVGFRSLIDSAADSFIVHDDKGRIVSVNRTACETLGYSRDELLTLNIGDIETTVSPEEIEKICASLQPGSSLALEGRHRRKDGTVFAVEVHLGNLQTLRRRLFLALVRDISGRKEAEKSLRKANCALTTLIQCNQALVRITEEGELLQEVCRIVVDIGGYDLAWVGLIGANGKPLRIVAQAGEEDGYLQTLSLPPAEPLPPALLAARTQAAQVVTPSGLHAHSDWGRAASANEFRAAVSIPLLHNGTTFGVLEICSTREDVFEAVEVSLLVELGEDLSYGVNGLRERGERLRIADELRLKSAALESAANAILITDRFGVIIWVNPAFTSLTGYAPEEVLGHHPRMFRSSHDGAYPEDLWETILSGRVWRGDMLNRRKDGGVYHEEQTITPVTDEAGSIRYFVAIKQDVTERKQAESALLENTRIRNEMEIARHIQRSLLPEVFPKINGAEVAARCVTASLVGGDYYDLFLHEDSQLVDLVIGDVSGHSVGAALMMTEVRSTLRATRDHARGPGDVLATLNGLLYDDLDRAELFISMFVATLDLQSRTLTYSNAGHNLPLVYRPSMDSFIELDADGMVLGVMRGIPYEEKWIGLEEGDLVLLYTDGIIEARDEEEELFSPERVLDVIRSSYFRSPAGIIEALFNQLSRFTGTTAWEDDISIVVVKIE